MPMKLFVSAQPSAPVSAYSRVVGLGYAGVLAVLALAQLFSFEAFIDILPAALYMGFGASAALVVAKLSNQYQWPILAHKQLLRY